MPRNPSWTRDELILALDLYFRVNPLHTSEKHPEIVALSEVLNSLPIHGAADQHQNFRNPNGVYMKLCNFLRLDPGYEGTGLAAGSRLDEEVWKEFAEDRERLAHVAQSIRANAPEVEELLENPPEEDDDGFEAPEGKVLTRMHRFRERDSKIVRRKKDSVMRAEGRLACEACGFDFARRYGQLGNRFAECHHSLPVSELVPGSRTRASDLRIVCSNCHRMIHRHRPWLTVEELRGMLRD